MRRILGVLVAGLLVVCPLLAGCSTDEEPDPDLVVFLTAGRPADRWDEIDEPLMRGQVELGCPECDFAASDADGDEATQREQLDQALEDGADVIVLDPVSADSGEELVGASDVPVVAYDRVVAGADYAVGIDHGAAGAEVARAVTDQLPPTGRVLVVGGPAGDGATFKAGLHDVLDKTKVEVVAEYDATADDPDEVADWVGQQLSTTPAAELDAILTWSDSQAAGAAAALEAASVPPESRPAVTGHGADLEAVRRIVAGDQAMTVYRSYAAEATAAGDLAVALVHGETPRGLTPHEGTPTRLFEPVVVTVDNLTDTVVRDHLYTLDDICDDATVPRCTALGLR